MKGFRDDLERRKHDRRAKRSSSWTSLILKIIFLIFVIMLIRFFGASDTKKFRDFINFSNSNPNSNPNSNQTEAGE